MLFVTTIPIAFTRVEAEIFTWAWPMHLTKWPELKHNVERNKHNCLKIQFIRPQPCSFCLNIQVSLSIIGSFYCVNRRPFVRAFHKKVGPSS